MTRTRLWIAPYEHYYQYLQDSVSSYSAPVRRSHSSPSSFTVTCCTTHVRILMHLFFPSVRGAACFASGESPNSEMQRVVDRMLCILGQASISTRSNCLMRVSSHFGMSAKIWRVISLFLHIRLVRGLCAQDTLVEKVMCGSDARARAVSSSLCSICFSGTMLRKYMAAYSHVSIAEQSYAHGFMHVYSSAQFRLMC
jgi:hypothetical protein